MLKTMFTHGECMTCLIVWLFDCLVGWFPGLLGVHACSLGDKVTVLTEWLDGWQKKLRINALKGWLTDWLVGKLVGLMTGRLVDWLTG